MAKCGQLQKSQKNRMLQVAVKFNYFHRGLGNACCPGFLGVPWYVLLPYVLLPVQSQLR